MNKEHEEYQVGEFSSAELEFLDYQGDNIETSKEQDDDFYELSSSIHTGVLLHIKLTEKLNNINPESASKNEVLNLILQINSTSESVNSLIKDVYHYSGVTNTFWLHCPLTTYRNYSQTLKSTYLTKHEGSTDLDFHKHEYLFFLKNTKKEKYNNTNHIHNSLKTKDLFLITEYYKVIDYETEELLQINNQRKLDFISNEIFDLGYIIQLAKTKKDVYINLIPVPETNDFEKLDETVLSKSQLPNFSLIERYEMLDQLGFIKKLHEITEVKKSKNKLLAITMNCSVDNARKLLDNTYKVKNRELNKARKVNSEEEVQGFFRRNDINI
ncbi:hypothetical protein [Winogradskyella pacifica]|uniref:hypothetical protein n=1 Tax=Winogradskyella pacifica TaxID=664642 RepID=UPI0015CC76F1|nr:hypothetical protein [Winogradskyella pacifica]